MTKAGQDRQTKQKANAKHRLAKDSLEMGLQAAKSLQQIKGKIKRKLIKQGSETGVEFVILLHIEKKKSTKKVLFL